MAQTDTCTTVGVFTPAGTVTDGALPGLTQDLYSGQSRSPHQKVAERPDPFAVIKITTKLVTRQSGSGFKIKPCLAYMFYFWNKAYTG